MNENCPYCNAEIEIDHDDHYGYEEDVIYHQECCNCEKTFAYTTYFIIGHRLKQADCLNGGEHDWTPTKTFPKEYTKMYCTMCDERRPLTADEYKDIVCCEPKGVSDGKN